MVHGGGLASGRLCLNRGVPRAAPSSPGLLVEGCVEVIVVYLVIDRFWLCIMIPIRPGWLCSGSALLRLRYCLYCRKTSAVKRAIILRNVLPRPALSPRARGWTVSDSEIEEVTG